MSTTTFNCVALPYGGKRAYRSSVFFSSLTIRKPFPENSPWFFFPSPALSHYEEHRFKSSLWHHHCHDIPLAPLQTGSGHSPQSCSCDQYFPTPGILKMWPLGRQPQPHLGSCWKCTFWGPPPDIPQKGLGVGLAVCEFTGSPSDADTPYSLKATVLIAWTTLPYSYLHVVEEPSTCFQKLTYLFNISYHIYQLVKQNGICSALSHQE